MTTKRLTELDALRGLAALAVVFYHFLAFYAMSYGHDTTVAVGWAQWGKFGVQLFFVVSGFVIFWTLQRTSSALDFIVSRFSRLYPVFWASVVVTFVVVSVAGLHGREVDFLTAAANLSMIHEYFGLAHVDGVYWTLTVELTFYALMLGLFMTNQLRHIEYWMGGLLLLLALQAAQVLPAPPEAMKRFFFAYINLFAAGICFFKIWQREHTLLTLLILLLSFSVNVLLYPGSEFLALVAIYAIFGLLVTGKLGFLRGRPLLFLGAISYPLYLVHGNVGMIVIRETAAAGAPSWLAVAVALGAVLVIATLLHKLVERPAMRALRASYRQSKRLPRLAAALTPRGLRKPASESGA